MNLPNVPASSLPGLSRRRRGQALRLAVAVLLTAGSVAVWTGTAFADTAAITAGGTFAATACAAGQTQSGTVTVTKGGTTAEQFGNNTTISASGSISAGGRTISVSGSTTSPSNWNGAANGATFTIGFTTTVPAGVTTFAATSLPVTVSGAARSGGTLSRSAGSVTVSAACDATPPVVTVPANKTVEATSSAGAAVTFASEVSATDAVDGARTVTCSPASGSTFPIGTTTVTCSATDASNNTGNASFTITVRDTTGPVVTVPANKSLLTSGAGENVTFASEVSATDAVDGSRSVTCSPASGSFFGIGTTTVNCSATDTRSNPGSASFTVTVAPDTTNPVVSVPANKTVEATGSAGAAVTFASEVSATDNLDGSLPASCSPTSGSTFPIGTTTVTCSATDASNNTGNASFTITVRDTTGPVVTVPADKNLLTAGGPIVVNYAGDVSATDAVDGARSVSCTPTSGSTFPIGNHTVTCTATDTRGNSGNASFTVNVALDTDDPVVTVPADKTVEATSATGRAVNFASEVSANDNLDGAITPTCSPVSGSTFPLGTTTVTCSATDDAGNEGSAFFDVTVRDTTAPTVTVPTDKTVEATSSAGAAVTFISEVSATDTVDSSVTPTCNRTSGGTFPVGTTTVTCSGTDDADNTGNASFTITVRDTTGPVVTVPADRTVEATGANGAAVTFAGGVSATDAVDGARSVSCDPASGSTFPLGTTTVECTATDSLGNEGSASFDITVEDTTDPAVTVPADKTVEATGPGGAAVDFSAEVGASDAVDTSPSLSCDPASGSTFPLGTTTVDCTATDDEGNEGSASFDITVEDTTDPTLSVPADATLEATGPSGRTVNFGSDVSATDLVDTNVSVSCTPPSGSTFGLGTTTVNCTGVDDAGNSDSGSFDITVEDTLLPVLDLPANITRAATSAAGAVVTYAAFANDLVSGSVPVTCAPLSGSTFPVGTTTVNCSATDGASNTANGSFTVTVTAFVPPTVPTTTPTTTAPTTPTTPTTTTPTTPTTEPGDDEDAGGDSVFTPPPIDLGGLDGGDGDSIPTTAPAEPAPDDDGTDDDDADGTEVLGETVERDENAGGTGEDEGDAGDGMTLTDSDGDDVDGDGEVTGGDELEVHVGGFDPFSEVILELRSEPVLLLRTQADANGEVRVRVTIPEGVEVGEHHIVAIGTDPDGQPREVAVPIRVVAEDSGSDAVIGPVAVGTLIVLAGLAIGLARRRRSPVPQQL